MSRNKDNRAASALSPEYYKQNPQAYNPNESAELRTMKMAKSQFVSMAGSLAMLGGMGILPESSDYCDGFIDTHGNFYGIPPFTHEQANIRLKRIMADDEYEFFFNKWLKVSRTLGGQPAAYLGQDGKPKANFPAKQKLGLQKWLKDCIRDKDWVEFDIFSWGIAERNGTQVRLVKDK